MRFLGYIAMCFCGWSNNFVQALNMFIPSLCPISYLKLFFFLGLWFWLILGDHYGWINLCNYFCIFIFPILLFIASDCKQPRFCFFLDCSSWQTLNKQICTYHGGWDAQINVSTATTYFQNSTLFTILYLWTNSTQSFSVTEADVITCREAWRQN